MCTVLLSLPVHTYVCVHLYVKNLVLYLIRKIGANNPDGFTIQYKPSGLLPELLPLFSLTLSCRTGSHYWNTFSKHGQEEEKERRGKCHVGGSIGIQQFMDFLRRLA